MSIDSINSVNSVNSVKTNKSKTSPIEGKHKQNPKLISEETLLLGSLAALALGGSVYLATRGHNSKAIRDVTNNTANKAEDMIRSKINPEFIEDKELKKVIEGLNSERNSNFSDSSHLFTYLDNMKRNLYINMLERFSNCQSPSELSKSFEELSTGKYNISEKALDGCADNINFEEILKSLNDDRKEQIVFAENLTSQKKLKIILDACAEDTRVRMLDRIKMHLPNIDSLTSTDRNKIIEKYYNNVIENLKDTFDFLSNK